MKNNIMKRIASCFCAFAFALAAIVVPLRVTQSENVAASAETTKSGVYNIYLPFLNFVMSESNNNDEIIGTYVGDSTFMLSIDWIDNACSLGFGNNIYDYVSSFVSVPISPNSGEVYERGAFPLLNMYDRSIETIEMLMAVSAYSLPSYATVPTSMDVEFYFGDDSFLISLYLYYGEDGLSYMDITFSFYYSADYQLAYVWVPLFNYAFEYEDGSSLSMPCGVLPFDPYLEYDRAYQNGYTAGNNAGYSQGYANGYANGLNDAEENGGAYTFRSLISSVIDVPLNAFRSLFSFEILGVDMLTFFSSLLTLGIILAVVRLIL